MIKIGITERGDPGLDFSWYKEYKKHKCDGIILITKELSDEFIEKAMETNCIVHATITGWGKSVIEPNVPDLDYSLYYFNELCECIGTEKVVLRIDPIIPIKEGVKKALDVYHKFYTQNNNKTRVRISFLDNYPHVKARFTKDGLHPLSYYFHENVVKRYQIYNMFNNKDIEVCGEPGFDSIGCISERDLKILNIDYNKEDLSKFTGFQRNECNCLGIKKELLNNKGQCKHRCLYCYWK